MKDGKAYRHEPSPEHGNIQRGGRLLNIGHVEILNNYFRTESAFSGRHVFARERQQDFHATPRMLHEGSREYNSSTRGS